MIQFNGGRLDSKHSNGWCSGYIEEKSTPRVAFTKSFAWLVCRVIGLFTPPTRQTSHANDFVNAKSHGREKPLLAG